MLLGDYSIVEATQVFFLLALLNLLNRTDDSYVLAHGEPTFHILPDKSSMVERTASIYRNR